MSTGKKQQKKRKRHSPTPIKSQIGRRLEKLRGGRRQDLWEDDDEDDDHEQSKTTTNSKACILLSDSDEERPSTSSSRNNKPRKKMSRIHDENFPSDNTSTVSKCSTCLICSVLSQLSSYNCCTKHLTALKNLQHQQTTLSTNNSQWLPQQVMIIPVTDDIIQRYLDPEQIRQLKTQASPIQKKTQARNSSSRKSNSKSTMTFNLPQAKESTKNVQKSTINSSEIDVRPCASTIVIESTRSNSATIPPDTSFTTVVSTSPKSIMNDIENLINLDTNQQQQQSPIQSIIIDDTQTDAPEVLKTKPDNQVNDPWIPISDEIDAALEEAIDQIDLSCDSPAEFTPTTARRTETEIMAARLPKIPLKPGRFRSGKPVISPTTTNAANEYRPRATSHSSPLASSIILTSTRSPPTTTIIEIESTIPPSPSIINQSENTPHDIIDSCLFTQDVISQHNNIPTRILSSEAPSPLAVINETSHEEIRIPRSNEIQHITSSTNNQRTTPARMSFRMNPDGTRVSISRPPLPTNPQSPLLNSLRRTSTDVTPILPNTKQV